MGEEGVYFDRPSPSYDQKDFVPVEVKAGSLVVIHGDLIHQRWARRIFYESSLWQDFTWMPANLTFASFHFTVLKISPQNQGMHTVCTWLILMVANGLRRIGEYMSCLALSALFDSNEYKTFYWSNQIYFHDLEPAYLIYIFFLLSKLYNALFNADGLLLNYSWLLFCCFLGAFHFIANLPI